MVFLQLPCLISYLLSSAVNIAFFKLVFLPLVSITIVLYVLLSVQITNVLAEKLQRKKNPQPWYFGIGEQFRNLATNTVYMNHIVKECSIRTWYMLLLLLFIFPLIFSCRKIHIVSTVGLRRTQDTRPKSHCILHSH